MTTVDRTYAMGYTDAERERLIDQAQLFGPCTRAMLSDAGLRPGMRVLDVGCGVGDVSFMAASFVGPTGQVVGVDSDPRSLEWARRRADEAGLDQVHFVQRDLHELESDEPFDAVVGRFILIHLADPADTLRRLALLVRPGGILAFQDFHFEYVPMSTAPVALWDEWLRLFLGTFRQAGRDTAMGMHLYQVFVDAGLPTPQIHMDIPLVRPGDTLGSRVAMHVLRSILPLMERFGIATPEQVDIDTFAERHAAEVLAKGAVHTTVPVVRAWTRVPAA